MAARLEAMRPVPDGAAVLHAVARLPWRQRLDALAAQAAARSMPPRPGEHGRPTAPASPRVPAWGARQTPGGGGRLQEDVLGLKMLKGGEGAAWCQVGEHQFLADF